MEGKGSLKYFGHWEGCVTSPESRENVTQSRVRNEGMIKLIAQGKQEEDLQRLTAYNTAPSGQLINKNDRRCKLLTSNLQ